MNRAGKALCHIRSRDHLLAQSQIGLELEEDPPPRAPVFDRVETVDRSRAGERSARLVGVADVGDVLSVFLTEEFSAFARLRALRLFDLQFIEGVDVGRDEPPETTGVLTDSREPGRADVLMGLPTFAGGRAAAEFVQRGMDGMEGDARQRAPRHACALEDLSGDRERRLHLL